MKIIIIGALPESLINFRGKLLKCLSDLGLNVIAMADSEDNSITRKLKDLNVRFQPFTIQRNGLNPFADFKTLFALFNFFRKENPDVIFAYTIKPVIWSGIASRINLNVKFYALITGLGFAFHGDNFRRKLLSKLVISLYRFGLKNSQKVIFQNQDNLNEFVSRGIVPRRKCELVNGSGVDLSEYAYTPQPSNLPIIFLTIGRLLGEKGFREYAEAARLVKKLHPEVIFQLLGPEDPSPDGINIIEVNKWQNDDVINYLGSASNVVQYIKECHVYVLPSYHEGMPRTVLEAMSIGRPILTTNVPGCRETVIPGMNGYLVPKANVAALAEKMIWFIENSDQYERMGKNSRKFAEEKYDVHKINNQLMSIMGIT